MGLSVKAQSQPGNSSGLIEQINPILRGWVNYFAAAIRANAFRLSANGWNGRFGGT